MSNDLRRTPSVTTAAAPSRSTGPARLGHVAAKTAIKKSAIEVASMPRADSVRSILAQSAATPTRGETKQGASTPGLSFRALLEAVRSQRAPFPPVPTMSADIKPLAKGDKARVAIYVAHPDDESGYAAGTLKKLAEKDHAVEAVMLTHGEGGRIVAKQGGEIVEQRAPKDFTVPYLVKTRDTEVKVAADWIGLQLQETLYPAAAGFDFDFTHDTAETLQRWDQLHPGGLAAMVTDLVDDIRRRQPDVVLVLGEEDLGGVKEHGHHKASAILVDLAARLAADPRVGSQPVHVVRELLSSAPRGKSDVHIDVEDNVMRNALLNYPSQFFPEMLPEVLGITKKEHGGRPSQECWSMRWQAKPANGQLGPSHSVLKTLLE